MVVGGENMADYRSKNRMKKRGDDSMRRKTTRTEKAQKETAMFRPVLVIALLSALVMWGLICMPGQAQATTPIASCGDCHGNPPVDNAAGRDAATGRFPGSHDMHAGTYGYSCANCHVTPNYSWYSHQDGNIQVQSLSAGSYSRGASFPATNAFSPGTCSNTYCHSKGTGGTLMTNDPRAVAANTSPLWGTVTTLTCTTCHGNETGNPGNGSPWYTTTGNGSGGGTKANSHQGHAGSGAVCNKCHITTTTTGNTITSVSNHANRTYNVIQGTGITFTYTWATNGGTCATISCHGGGTMKWGTGTADCVSCHSGTAFPKSLGTGTIRRVVGTGGDFNMASAIGTTASRHLMGATTIVKWDCIICHREGSTATGKANSSYHNDGTAPTGGLIHLRNVDTTNEAVGWAINNSAWTTTDYRSLDTFCLSCHDSNGAAAVSVNATNNGIGGNALKPFNSTDQLAGGWLKGTNAIPNALRDRVVDVKSQFYAGTTMVGTYAGIDGVNVGVAGGSYNGNYSQHAVIGKRYSTINMKWGTIAGGFTAWGSVTLRKIGQQVNIVKETAILSCADCHVLDSGSGAHGGASLYNLRMTTVNAIDSNCNMCHSSQTYSTGGIGTTPSRIQHGDLDGGDPLRPASHTKWGWGSLSANCMGCHAGYMGYTTASRRTSYGGIHGNATAQYGWATVGGPMISSYRFFPGSQFKHNPASKNGDGGWTTSGAQNIGCYMYNATTQGYFNCTRHNGNSGSDNGTPYNYVRPLRY